MEFYVSSKHKESEQTDGSQEHPFESVQELLKNLKISDENVAQLKVYIEAEDTFKEISKAQFKKEMKLFKTSERKVKSTTQKVEQKCQEEEAVESSINEDVIFPEATKSKINELHTLRDRRVVLQGWVQHLRKQGKKLLFVKLRDETGFLQCMFENKLARDADILTCESSVRIYGSLVELPEGKMAEGGHELKVDQFELICTAPSGGVDSVLNTESDPDVLFNNRHLMLRGENASRVVRLQSVALRAFRRYYESRGVTETILPALVQSQCEGGSTLFKLDYFGEEAYLTQSSQLYLETMVPVVGNCFTIAKSFRAEKSRTRRHLTEYTHIEAESGNITYEDLLNDIEDLLVTVSTLVMEIDGETLLKVNKDFKPLQKPFRRMEYKDAIEFLREHNILKPDGTNYEFGEDIPEGAERAMLAIIDEPIMLLKFPCPIKSFYMSKCVDDDRVTESVDVLLPGVGEIVGGSMRIWDHKELMAAYAREKLDSTPYYWYTDQRMFGSVPHGGYGLGFERFLTWMLFRALPTANWVSWQLILSACCC